MRIRAIIPFFIIVISCQGIESIEKPDNLIPLKKMEDIIYDMTIINSARGFNIQLFTQTGVKPETHIFEKYEIDSLQYAASTVYYSADIDQYKKIIDNVRKRVTSEFEIADSLTKIEKRIKDSIRNVRGKRLKEKKDSTLQAQRKVGRVEPKTAIEPNLEIPN